MRFPLCAIVAAVLLFHNIALTTSQADDLIVRNSAPQNNKSIATQSVETPYIIGGSDADIENYNYMCILRFQGRLICTCFIISEKYVLTAAHCVVFDDQPQNPRDYSVVAGTPKSDGTGGTVHQVNSIIPNEKYTSDGTNDDIAAIVLKKPLVFGPKIGLICLPTTDMFEDRPKDCSPRKQKVVRITGFGVDKEGSDEPAETLQEATVRIFNHYCCELIYFIFRIKVDDTHICVGGEDKNTCYGDSGSPLVHKENGSPCAVGITSFGSSAGCAYEGIPSVSTKVFSQKDWLRNHGVKFCNCGEK